MIWWIFETLSWKLTKGVIGLDPISAMHRYLDWVRGKHKSIQTAREDLEANLTDLEDRISTKEKSRAKHQDNARIADQTGKNTQAELYAMNALADKEYLEGLIPLRDMARVKVGYLTELDEVFGLNTEQLKYRISNIEDQHSIITATHKGMRSADDVLGDSAYAKKLFDEAVKQAGDQMNRMTAQINRYEKNIKPMLESAKFDKEVRSGEARQLLEELRRDAKQIPAATITRTPVKVLR